MNDIYDVFRMLVQSARANLPDARITEAMTIIDDADAARRPRPSPLEQAVAANADILAQRAREAAVNA
jgi:hypothetical protein